MQVEISECGCERHTDAGQVVRVDTCPECLPAGAITWLVENGRQLELLEEEGVPSLERGRTELERMSEIMKETRLKAESTQGGNHA